MDRWTDWVLRHRTIVVWFWLVVALAGGATAPTTVDRLSFDFALPGAAAYETNTEVVERFGNGGANDPLVAVVTTPGATSDETGTASGTADRLGAVAAEAVPGTRVLTPSDADVLAAGDHALALLWPPVVGGPEPYAAAEPRLAAAVDRVAGQQSGVQVELTGFAQLSESGGGSDRGVLAEVLLGGAGALVVLVLVFGSLLAGLPLLVAAVSILGTFLALLGLTALTDVSFVVQFLIALIGLGVAIDYSLLVVTRWREERDAGAGDDEAVRTAMRTAGESVLFSGTTVTVSLAALVLVPIPFLRSIGLGGLLIPLLSVGTALSLVPVLLRTVGPRLLWPRRTPARSRSPLWTRIASGVLRRRWTTVVLTTGLLLALAAPVLGLSLGSPQLSGLAGTDPGARAVSAAVADGVPAGVLRPVEVVVDDGSPRAEDLSRLRGVAAAVTPEAPGWRTGGGRLVAVVLADDPASTEGRESLEEIRVAADSAAARVGGSAAEDADFVSEVYSDVGWVVLAIVVLTFGLLARALRSLWLPVKALVLNVLSIAAAYGVTVLIWQDGYGSDLLFGQGATGAITVWVPIAAFAFLFGLSMDYEVFILSRMREAYDDHGDTDRAVVDGIAHTGRLVTSAALILFLAFVALSTVPTVEVKILATALALGIAIDAVVVRGLLAPALVAVLGRANWTLPVPLRRLLRVRDHRHVDTST